MSIRACDVRLHFAYANMNRWLREGKEINVMLPYLMKYVGQQEITIRMPEEIHFHMLRKTRAMDLYQAGCPLSYIQQIPGHENISTTSEFYAFATLKTLADAIEKVNPSGVEKKEMER